MLSLDDLTEAVREQDKASVDNLKGQEDLDVDRWSKFARLLDKGFKLTQYELYDLLDVLD